MSEAVLHILEQLKGLSRQERAEVARAALLSFEPEDSAVEEAWKEELQQRVDRIRKGQAVGFAAAEVFAQFRRDHP